MYTIPGSLAKIRRMVDVEQPITAATALRVWHFSAIAKKGGRVTTLSRRASSCGLALRLRSNLAFILAHSASSTALFFMRHPLEFLLNHLVDLLLRGRCGAYIFKLPKSLFRFPPNLPDPCRSSGLKENAGIPVGSEKITMI